MQKPKIKKILDSKLLYFIIALFASFALWLYVSTVDKVTVEQTFSNIPLVFSGADTIRDTRELVVTQVSTNTVSIRVEGQRTVISKLNELADEITAVIDISGITEPVNNRTTFSISFPSEIDPSEVTILSRTPSIIEYYVDKQTSKTIDVEVRFVGSVAEGYIVSQPIVDPLTVRISGPEKVIEQVDHAYIEINREDVDTTLQFSTEYQLIDASGNQVVDDSIVLETETVNVTLPVEASKEVALSVDIVYSPETNSQNTIVTIEPSAITIVGDAELLDGINRISLGQIDLSDIDEYYQDTYSIVLDNGISNQTGTTEATVTVEIRGLETKEFVVTNLSYINLADGYSADIFTRSLTVKLRATADILDDITASNIRAVADLSDYTDTVGDFTVPVRIYISDFSEVGAVGDYSIYVSISEGDGDG